VGPAPVRRAVPFGTQHTIVVYHGIEDSGQHASVGAAIASEAIEHELRDRRVPYQLGPAQDL